LARVLVLDDEESVRELCAAILTTEGFGVLAAADARSGVEVARAERPDLILLDWMMPEVDGLDALRVLKQTAATAAIPVVMLTALDGTGDIALATLNGADGYVSKPFEPDTLVTLVRRFVADSAVAPSA
jgi:DNA-binding response OmpR family regulator